MRILLFAALFVLGSAYRLDTKTDVCSIRGPVYWCKNEKTAQECQATSYCKEHHWNKLKTQVNDDVCNECQEYVGLLHSLLSDKDTQKQIIDAITQMCSQLPSPYSTMCSNYVPQELQSVINQLIQMTNDSKAFCTELGLCTGSKQAYRRMKVYRSIMKELFKWKQVSADVCTTCQQYVGTVHLILSNPATKTEVLNELTQLCQQYAKGSAVCSLISSIGGEAYDKLVAYLATPKTLCTSIGLCSSQQLQEVSVDYCTTCEQYVGTVHLLLSNAATKTEVLNELTNLCKQYVQTAGVCDLVSTYGGELYDELVAYLATPQKLCTTLGFCSGTGTKSLVQHKENKYVIKMNMPEAVSSLYSNEICEACTFAMTYVESLLKENSTQQELKSDVLKICNDLPPSVSGMCTQYVNMYWSAVMELLITELADSKAICTTIHLCSAHVKGVHEIVPKHQTKVSNPVTCEVCELAMQYLDTYIGNNKTEEKVKEALDGLCQKLPTTIQSECTSLVDQYADQIIQLIVHELADPSTVCKELGLCSSKAVQKKVSKVSNPVTCEVCQYAIQYLDQLLEENSTEAEVKAALDKVCGYLPSEFQSECDSLVDQYTDQIIKLIVHDLTNPSTVCKELGLCSSKAVQKKVNKVSNPVTCEVCQYAMRYLDSMLTQNSTEEEVKEALDQLCTYLPDSMKSECTSLVNQYTDQIINLIVQELTDPATLCKELGLCTSTKKGLKKVPIKDDIGCEVCTDALEVLENILKEKRTEDAIKAGLDKLCEKLPSSIASECEQLVNQYGQAILELLINEVNPDTVCKELKLCTSSVKKVVVKTPAKKEVKGAVTCELCNLAMGELMSVLKDNDTIAEIKTALKGLCSRMPKHLNDECNMLVNQYFDLIVKILTEESPDAVCDFIKLCPSNKMYTGANRKYMLAKRLALRGVSCEVCTVAIGYLDSILTDNSTEATIEKEVMALCSHLPDAIKNECDALIIEYGDELIKLIVQQIQPDKVCKALGVCQ